MIEEKYPLAVWFELERILDGYTRPDVCRTYTLATKSLTVWWILRGWWCVIPD